jgi:hypothetical protein
MSEASDSARPPRRLIDKEAKARFLAGLRAGAAREEAAAAAGFPLKSLYGARRRDPLFRLGWTWALELSASGEQAARRAGGHLDPGVPAGAPVRIAPNGGRLLQRRRMRWVRFTEARQQAFLDHFAGTADAHQAAEAAGVCYATVTAHRRNHPEFAALWDATLREAVAGLEAEAVRQRLEMQQRLKENLEPKGEMAAEFERVMKLLARWDRRDGRVGPREVHHGRQRRWTFEEAMAALDKRLRSLGLRHGIPDSAP